MTSVGRAFILPILAKKKKSKSSDNTIALNRIARHDYFIEDELEVGIVLEGLRIDFAVIGHFQLL